MTGAVCRSGELRWVKGAAQQRPYPRGKALGDTPRPPAEGSVLVHSPFEGKSLTVKRGALIAQFEKCLLDLALSKGCLSVKPA